MSEPETSQAPQLREHQLAAIEKECMARVTKGFGNRVLFALPIFVFGFLAQFATIPLVGHGPEGPPWRSLPVLAGIGVGAFVAGSLRRWRLNRCRKRAIQTDQGG